MRLVALLALTVGLTTGKTLAQGRPPRGPGQTGGGRFPMDPLMFSLDANTNNVIEATEIASASDALKKLDKNIEGKLRSAELKPQRPNGGNQPSFNPPGGGRRPTSPLLLALDANGDGELDATEIASASDALKQLDAHGAGQLTLDEQMLKPPGELGGPGAPPQ